MKISREMFDSVKADFLEVIRLLGLGNEWDKLDHGTSGLRVAYSILHQISFDRSYDDNHPAFKAGRVRLLPYDGREYCFYYADGCNDDHVKTMLKKILEQIRTGDSKEYLTFYK